MSQSFDTTPDPKDAGLDAQALRNLKTSIQNDIEQGRIFGATMLVARGGKLAFRESLGTVAPGRAAKNDDVYLMMSLSKSFAAALTLRAIEQGRFTLDTRVAEILPEFAVGGRKHITVHQILSHQAGLYSELPPPAPYQLVDLNDLDKMYQAVVSQPVAYVPGERVCYTPFAGHAVAAKLLMVTDPKQRRFSQIANDELFQPLGMTETRYGNAVSDPRRVAVSHTQKMTTPASGFTASFLNGLAADGAEFPGAGAYGTAEDVLRFAEALRMGGTGANGHRLLSAAMVEYASRNQCADKINDAWVSYCIDHDMPQLRANFTLLGGYSRGEGQHLAGTGFNASAKAFCAVGGGSTMFMVDPPRDLSVVFLSAGFIEGLAHFQRLSRLNDLAVAACI